MLVTSPCEEGLIENVTKIEYHSQYQLTSSEVEPVRRANLFSSDILLEVGWTSTGAIPALVCDA